MRRIKVISVTNFNNYLMGVMNAEEVLACAFLVPLPEEKKEKKKEEQ